MQTESGSMVEGAALPAPDFVPPVGWAAGPLGAVQRAERAIGRHTAARAREVAAFAASRPSSADRQVGEPGCASAETRAARPEVLEPVSEWAAQELMVALSVTRQRAETLLVESMALVHRLPATLDALEAGRVHTGHLRVLLDRLAPIGDHGLRQTVEADVLSWLAGRDVTTAAQLADRARRVVLARDPLGAAQRLAAAIRERGVSCAPGQADGMSSLMAVLTTPEARACSDALGRCADALVDEPRPDGTPARTRAQKMADCLVDRILRPGDSTLPVVTARLTVVASVETLAGGDQPGEVDGEPVPAELVRALARSLGLVPDDPAVPPPSHLPATPGEAPARDDAPAHDDRAAVHGGASAGGGASTNTSAGAVPLFLPGVLTGRETGREGVQGDGSTREVASQQPEEHLPQLLAMAEECAWDWDAAWAVASAAALGAPTAPPDDAEWWEAPGPEAGELLPPPDLAGVPVGWFTGSEALEVPGVPGGSAHERDGRGLSPGGSWRAADAATLAASVADAAARRALGEALREVEAAEAAVRRDEAAFVRSPGGAIGVAGDTLTALASATVERRRSIGELLMRTGGGGLVDRPRIALVDALSGELLALSDGPELRRRAHCGRRACADRAVACTHDLSGRTGVGPPRATDGYRPSAELDRFVRARDRRCRFPGCRVRVHQGELDHRVPYPQGETAAGNLQGFCVHHHRGKHQAAGWTVTLEPDGSSRFTTPSGLTARTAVPSLLDTGRPLRVGSSSAPIASDGHQPAAVPDGCPF